MTTNAPWQVPILVEDIPESGLRRVIEADADVRKAVASLAGLHDVARLRASFDLKPSGSAVHLVGRVQAIVGQTCVVTLDLMESEIDEEVDLMLSEDAPSDMNVRGTDDENGLENDPPETIVDGRIDLGVLAVEFMILGLDPYPRKPGVTFEPLIAPADPADHPFAGLAALKPDESSKKSRKSKSK